MLAKASPVSMSELIELSEASGQAGAGVMLEASSESSEACKRGYILDSSTHRTH